MSSSASLAGATIDPAPAADDEGAGATAAPGEPPATVTLRGTGRGLEILVSATAGVDAIGEALTALLAEAPSFFAGNAVRIAVDGALPAGALARLEEVTARFDLSITAIGPVVARPTRAVEDDAGVPQPSLAEGSAPVDGDADLVDGEPVDLTDVELDEPIAAVAPGPRLVVGPVRSGVVLHHPGHVVVMGDVNPGAEVRADGNIIVLGCLRGIAHAGVGGEAGFILALTLQPQQLRVGRLVARAAAGDGPGDGIEIAYATGKTIVVERYQGRLPSGLAASM